MQKRIFGLETEYSPAIKGQSYCTAHASNIILELFRMTKDGRFTVPLLEDHHFFPKQGQRFFLGSNGARFYFDNEHKLPEYATPECLSIRECLLHSMAGDRIVEDIRKESLRELGPQHTEDLIITRINTVFGERAGGDTVGCHENYMTLASFIHLQPNTRIQNISDLLVHYLAPFLASRIIFDGAGAIRFTPERGWHYVISQRAFFMRHLSSPSPQGDRGFVTFRVDGKQECPPENMRLHLHCGDLFMSPFGKFIAMGATHLMLRAIEERETEDPLFTSRYHIDLMRDHVALASDPTLQAPFSFSTPGGSCHLRAVDIQRECIEFVLRHVRSFVTEEKEYLQAWIRMTDMLANDPSDASEELDWAIKHALLTQRFGEDFSSPKARLLAYLYHDISERGVYHRLVEKNLVKRFASEKEVALCRITPPKTRAEFRARYLKAVAPLHDKVQFIENWGRFAGPPGFFGFADITNPFDMTTPQGEALLLEIEGYKQKERRPFLIDDSCEI